MQSDVQLWESETPEDDPFHGVCVQAIGWPCTLPPTQQSFHYVQRRHSNPCFARGGGVPHVEKADHRPAYRTPPILESEQSELVFVLLNTNHVSFTAFDGCGCSPRLRNLYKHHIKVCSFALQRATDSLRSLTILP